MKKLSQYQKSKIVIQIIESLKELPNKGIFYILEEENELMQKIAKKGGIDISYSRGEAGRIDISEYIQLTYEDIEYRWEKKLNPQPKHTYHPSGRGIPEFKVSEELKQLTEKFENKNIPDSGPCETLIGEMFRAIQRIRYRAFNDGDMWYVVGSDSFMSYMYLISMIDELNWSRKAYNEESGQYSFDFTDEFILKHSYDGKINTIIDSPLGEDSDFLKYQLMDLLSNNKIEDKPNEYDSRSFTRLKTESRY